MSLIGLIGADKSFSLTSFSGGRQLIAAKPFATGEVLGYTKGTIVTSPDMHSIQLTSDRHLDVRGSGLELASHSCEPNCRMIVRTFEEHGEDSLSLVSIAPIVTGDTITWDYETTEWALSSPFTCSCESKNCKGVIRGVKYLSNDRRAELLPYSSGFIKAQLGQEHCDE